VKFFLADRNWIGDWCGGWTEVRALGGLRANCGRRKRRVSPKLSDEDCQVSGPFVEPFQCIGSEGQSDGLCRPKAANFADDVSDDGCH